MDCWLVGLHVLPHRLTQPLLRSSLTWPAKATGRCQVKARMWCMRSGALAHFSHGLQDVINNIYHDKWIGRAGPTAWPPCLPDLNPLDIYLWGHLKTLMYAAHIDNEEALHHHIVDTCRTIHSYPSISEQMEWSMMRHVEVCTESHGGHFEHLL
jgi:hypothetical protein